MSDQVRWTDPAAKAMRHLSRQDARRIRDGLVRLAETGTGDTRKIVGSDDVWRLRVGDYRVIFGRDRRQSLVVVLAVRHRREAYR